MTSLRNIKCFNFLFLVIVISLAACSTPITVKPIEPSASPTFTPLPSPTATLLPIPTITPTPSITVCASGCDFETIQAALEHSDTVDGTVIGIADAIHTEASIVIEKSITIQGTGPQDTIVQAHAEVEGADDRVFFVSRSVSVTLRGMTIRHGNPSSEPESGGGLRNEGTLTLENCVVRDNSGSAGGGILNDGVLTLIGSVVRDNEARGGGIRYSECSTGGGIKNMEGVVTLINSAVLHNTSIGKGGGAHVSCKGKLILINSTISGNTTNEDGGGVFLDGEGAFTHSTISDNQAKNGGGLYISGSAERNVIRGLLNYTSTIIAGNVARMEKYGAADCFIGDYGSIDISVNNLVEDGVCSQDLSADPLLAPLDQGRPEIHALLPGSPAIDAVPVANCTLLTDQRGMIRPALDACDIGAFEVQEGESVSVGALVEESSARATQTPVPQTDASMGDGIVRGWAILAEKDDYGDVKMTDLPIDYINIEKLREVLKKFGWRQEQIREVREFDQQSLRDALNWVSGGADRDDIIFLYVAAHGKYLSDVMAWADFFPDEWDAVVSERRVLLMDSCQAAQYTAAVNTADRPSLSIAAVDVDEYAWAGLEEEGLPIIGGVFTHYFAAAFTSPDADGDGDGAISIQEAALWAEGQQRTYMHDEVFAVPEFLEMYHQAGSYPDKDPDFPNVVVDDTLKEPLYFTIVPEDQEMKTEELKITVVYDNNSFEPQLRTEWGFSALVTLEGQTLLFDTGGQGQILLGNMEKLEIDPQSIDKIVLSHIHGDHTGGLQALLDTGIRPVVYVPASFPDRFKREVSQKTELVEIAEPQEILPGVYSTGELGASIVEQGLVIDTSEGAIVITGCAHPGIVRMIRKAHEIVPGDLLLAMGGFHLGGTSRARIKQILRDFRELDVQHVMPTHCTGEEAIALFAEEYGVDYIQGGAGQVFVLSDAK